MYKQTLEKLGEQSRPVLGHASGYNQSTQTRREVVRDHVEAVVHAVVHDVFELMTSREH